MSRPMRSGCQKRSRKPHRAVSGALMACLAALLCGVAHADSCTSTPCFLPCTATSTASQILGIKSNRTDLVVCNWDTSNVLTVLTGAVQSGAPTAAYGFPVPAATCLHAGVQPNPQANIHTWSSAVSIITGGPTITCSYQEKAD